jgi:CubicO group peptidase (beta-lactamase class C family)
VADSLDDLVRRTARRVAAGPGHGAVVVGAVQGEESALSGADPRTLFEIGSISKTFTALALARLAVSGAVRLDQPLRELVPGDTTVPERDGRSIELVHLACHTSGLPRLPRGMLPRALFWTRDPYAGCTADMVLGGLRRTRLRSVPGHRFHYSNLGGGLLGLALARHTGRDYDTLIQEQICAPLGLTDTRVVLDQERAARLAPGHSRTGGPRPRWRMAALAGAGGLHSTVPDLLRFARAQFGDGPGELAEAIALTHDTSHREDGQPTVHPGWISPRPPGNPSGTRVLFHNGGTGGYRSLLAVAPERRTAVALLSATAVPVDHTGLDLLAELAAP